MKLHYSSISGFYKVLLLKRNVQPLADALGGKLINDWLIIIDLPFGHHADITMPVDWITFVIAEQNYHFPSFGHGLQSQNTRILCFSNSLFFMLPVATGWLQAICFTIFFMCKRKVSNFSCIFQHAAIR